MFWQHLRKSNRQNLSFSPTGLPTGPGQQGYTDRPVSIDKMPEILTIPYRQVTIPPGGTWRYINLLNLLSMPTDRSLLSYRERWGPVGVPHHLMRGCCFGTAEIRQSRNVTGRKVPIRKLWSQYCQDIGSLNEANTIASMRTNKITFALTRR